MRILDVARRAGVSAATVSLVMNGKGSIGTATVRRVREAADELGYHGNALARGLRRNTSDVIGFVSDVITTTPHAGALVAGANDRAREAGKLLLLIDTESDPEAERAGVDALRGYQVDGIIWASMYHRLVTPPEPAFELPMVVLDAQCDDPRASWVVPDERGAAYDATRHLIDLGHRQIGHLSVDVDIPAVPLRLRGYQDALAEAGIEPDPALVASGAENDVHGGMAAADELLAADRPTALFCFSDAMAVGAMRVARRRGLRIPEELSIVGFDDQQLIAPLADPPLTTMRLPHYEMGTWAMQQLLHGDGIATRLEPCPLVQRDSAVPRG